MRHIVAPQCERIRYCDDRGRKRQLSAGGCICAPHSRSGVAHRRYILLCKLQTLAAPGTTKEMIFEGRTLLLGQSTQKVRLDRLFWIGGAATNFHGLMLSQLAVRDKHQKVLIAN